MNELLMNDTLENFNFTQNTNLVINNFLESGLVGSKENVTTKDISLDDTAFLSQINFSGIVGNKITNVTPLNSNNKKYVEKHKTNIKSTNNKENVICNEDNLKSSQRRSKSFQSNNVIKENSINSSQKTYKSQKNNLNYDLSLWGLPEKVLQKYESKNLKTMFHWQAECLSNDKVLNGKNLVYSAPTSAGKTLVAEIIAIKTILEIKKKVIFILPFVSIVREKMFYFQNLLESSGIRVDGFMGSYNPPGGFQSVHLAICTIEKANSLINRLLEEGRLNEIGAMLIDEMHLLGDPGRGYLLELLLTKLRYISNKNNLTIQIIGMSATLPNLNEIANWLNAELYITDYRPVPLQEQAQINGEIYDKNSKLIRKIDILPELKSDTDNILQLCLETIKESCSVLIFCPTKNWCENLAQQIATGFLKIGSFESWTPLLTSQLNLNLITELLEQLKFCPVGLDTVLRKTVSLGVAFHHAGLTMDERDIIEGGFRNGVIRVLVATSTLSSGVNLPARRVIIRTPIFYGKPLNSLVYRQMIGRAGRMGKDSMGESFLICQKNDFTVAKTLMSAELTPIRSCLETNGKLNRAILEVIASGVVSTSDDIQLFVNSTLLAAENGTIDELNNPIKEAVTFLQMNEFIRVQKQDNVEKYIATSLGKACLASSLPPEEGLSLFTELEKARQCLVLETELHLIYLVTPFSSCYSWENIDWMLYLDIWEKLPSNMKKVGELIGIRQAYIINGTRKKLPTDSGKNLHKYLIHKRFFIALALQDLVNEKSLSWVCQKFNCNRGMLQTLQQSASSFAGMVTAFSKQLGWSSMELLLSQFQDRLQFGVGRDLLDLMHLPVLNGKVARSLFNSGIETMVQLANSDVNDIENILLRMVPFESEKSREGESEFEKKLRNKFKNVWINGREGLTEREAAEIFVNEARRYLKMEMGLVDAKWKDESEEDNCEINKSVNEKNVVDTNRNDSKTEQSIEIESVNSTDNKLDEETYISETSSLFSSNFNISDNSIVDSPKIEEPLITNNNSQLLFEKFKNISLNSPIKEKFVTKLFNDISLSDFSETLSEVSTNKSIKISQLHANEGSDISKVKNGDDIDKNNSNQSLFDESFTLNLSNSSKDSAIGGLNDQVHFDSLSNSFIQKAFEESFKLSNEEVSIKKRKCHSFDGNLEMKKFKDKEIERNNLNKTYVKDGGNTVDFSRMEIVDVCKDLTVLEAFSKEIKELNYLSFSTSCNEYKETKPKIGMNILEKKIESINPESSDENCLFFNNKKIEGFSFSWGEKENVVYYLSLGDVKLQQKILKLLKIVFKNPDLKVRIFDAKEQIKLLKQSCGVNFYSRVEDPKIADWILDPEGKEKNLNAMVVKYFPEGTELSRLSGGCKGVGSVSLDTSSTVNARIRSSLEAILTFHLIDTLKNILHEENPNSLLTFDIENEVILVLSRLEINGFGINKNGLNTLLDTLKFQINLLEKQAYALAGRKFNFASSADVAKVTGLFRGKKVSTRKQILEKNQHPISDFVLHWRKLHSILTKTLYPLIQAIKNNRIYGCYITHTATGRISMHEPNLQNINKDFQLSSPVTKEIITISCREVFEAQQEGYLVSADYSQLELRVLTHFSQDETLCRIMKEPGDVFRMIAAKWNKIKEDEVTDNLRQSTKHLCYGIIYGMGSKALADQLNLQETDAVEFMDAFKDTYPGIKKFIIETIENCRKCGYVETLGGRKRFLPHINENELSKRNQAERQAVNTIIQGSAADIVKSAMIKVEKELDNIFNKSKSKPKLVLYLHDELIYDVPNKYLKKVARIIKKNMENSVELSVPFPVKLKSGTTWANMIEFNL